MKPMPYTPAASAAEPVKHHHFDFTVTGLTDAQAAELFQFIWAEIEFHEATAGGGLAEVTADGETLEAEAAQ